MLYVFFWVIPQHLNSDPGELPRRKHTTYRTRWKFKIKNKPTYAGKWQWMWNIHQPFTI